jgi:hypothetical protein
MGAAASALIFVAAIGAMNGRVPRGAIAEFSLLVAGVFLLCAPLCCVASRRLPQKGQRFLVALANAVLATLIVIVLFREPSYLLLPSTSSGWLEILPWFAAFSGGGLVTMRVVGSELTRPRPAA